MKPSLIVFSPDGVLAAALGVSEGEGSLAHPVRRPALAVPATPRARVRTTSLRFHVLLLMRSSGGGGNDFARGALTHACVRPRSPSPEARPPFGQRRCQEPT